MRELLDTALTAAREAAGVHRTFLGRVDVEDWTEKGAADFVTHVDRAAEAGILRHIRARFPDHGFMAEEETSERLGVSGVPSGGLGTGWTWVIDPLDGTTNFLHGYPMYAVSIGVAHAGVLQAAVVLNSATGEEWTALRGGGSCRNGERVYVSGISELRRALVGTGFPFKALHLLPEYTAQLGAVLRATSGVRRAGSAALDLCHVASGWFDGFWELTLAPWDVAAGTLIVREAGGVVTRLDGSDDVVGHGSLLAGNELLHEALGDVVRNAAQAARAAAAVEPQNGIR